MQKHPASRPKQPTWPFNHASNLGSIKNSRAFTNAFTSFKANYPEYELGSSLDSLRKTEFGRLKKANEVYADYMGGCLWPECLVAAHTAILQAGLFGNTHSDSPCATRSDFYVATARKAVLDYFEASSEEYACIFTANATGALKAVGESFPFKAGSTLVIPTDCHNSVNGIRRFAEAAGARVEYLQSTEVGGFYEEDAIRVINARDPGSDAASLFILTGQSNVTGIRPSTDILETAKSRGFSTLIDAAALASSAHISMAKLPSADAIAVSFYKMFGYPTGVGALIAKKSFLRKLERKWFSGGSVEFVQTPGSLVIHAEDLAARFEEGTLNYGALSAIAPGLDLLRTYMPAMSIRLPALHHYLHRALESLVYPGTTTHLVQIHTKLRSLSHRRSNSTMSAPDYKGKSARETGSFTNTSSSGCLGFLSLSRTQLFRRFHASISTTKPQQPSIDAEVPEDPTGSHSGQGYIISCSFYSSHGTIIPLNDISRLASASGISLRTGCVCNPGGSTALRGKDAIALMGGLSKFGENVELEEVWAFVGGITNAGIIRLSLGMVSDFEDVWRIVEWARGLLDEGKRAADLEKLNL